MPRPLRTTTNKYHAEERLGFATRAESWRAMELFDESGDRAEYPYPNPADNGLWEIRVRRLIK